jgi:hypothetical protein
MLTTMLGPVVGQRVGPGPRPHPPQSGLRLLARLMGIRSLRGRIPQLSVEVGQEIVRYGGHKE